MHIAGRLYWLSHAQARKRTNKPKHTEEKKVEKRSEVEQGRSGRGQHKLRATAAPAPGHLFWLQLQPSPTEHHQKSSQHPIDHSEEQANRKAISITTLLALTIITPRSHARTEESKVEKRSEVEQGRSGRRQHKLRATGARGRDSTKQGKHRARSRESTEQEQQRERESTKQETKKSSSMEQGQH